MGQSVTIRVGSPVPRNLFLDSPFSPVDVREDSNLDPQLWKSGSLKIDVVTQVVLDSGGGGLDFGSRQGAPLHRH